MPELPEVETTARALRPFLEGHRIRTLDVRETRLRWPVRRDLGQLLAGARVHRVSRRAKYLLLETDRGTLIVHLGMSGRFCVATGPDPEKHDHVDIVTDQGVVLRYRDPRRFGAFVWTTDDPARHPLLADLGPEPWDPRLDAAYLFGLSRRRTGPVKTFVMDGGVVVGVGNIYANEALFMAGIRPGRAASRVTRAEYGRLVTAIREVLARAIRVGGTTLRDFASGTGEQGYFRIELAVYGREGEPCTRCGARLRGVRIAGRATVYCPQCQR